ncbi:MAG: diguanylate cyclase [Pseudomonadota bacterium]|nr:diguanylate cyclase [Pseudomonadota bacterium]
MRLLAVVLATLILCWPGTLPALQPDKALHQYVRGNWSIEQGLPQISALAITQDRAGYIWVGTQAGLARFDGVRMVEYTSETAPGLPGNWVPALHLADDGRMWIGTYKGVAIYDGHVFTPVPVATGPGATSLDTRAFAQDAQGVIWVASTEGVHRVRDGRLHAVPGSPLLAQSLLARTDGLWVGARGAVHRFDGDRWETLQLPSRAATATVNGLAEAHGRMWAATTMGLFVHSSEGWQSFAGAPQLSGASIDMLYLDRDANLWAGGDVGLARIREAKLAGLVTPTDPGGIAGVRTAFEDREGGLWIGSQWEGLTRLGDSWTRRYSVAEGLNSPIVWAVAGDPDGRRIWVGGNEGLSVLEDEEVRLVVPASALPHPQAYNLLAETDRVWVGTRRGLAVVEPDAAGTPRVRLPALFAPLLGTQINGILRLDNQDLWIGSTDGMYRLRSGVLRRYAQADGLPDPRVRFFFHTSEGDILAGTQSGLFQLRGERFFPVGEDAGLPPELDVTAVGQLEDGRWLVGAMNEQIHVRHEGRWQVLGIAQGMPGNAPFFFTERNGYLWVAGIRGISRVPVADLAPLAEGKIAQVRGQMLLNERGDARSGQQGYCCNGAGNSKGLLRDSTLWLPTRDGLLAMDVDAITQNTVAPGVVIERMQSEEKWHAADTVHGTTLPKDARDLSFEFTVLSFQDPKSIGVQYRLLGYDRDWRQADPLNRNARYTNLPPGDYVFEVAGTNNFNVAGTASALLPFAIAPFFHETAWFGLLVALLLAALVFAGYRLMRHRHRLQRQSLEVLVLQRTQALELANCQLEEASHTDPLTGLRNRRYMGSQIPADLAYYDRQLERGMHMDEVMVFAVVDIDYFKAINDSHGHSGGDLVLQQFAQLLNSLVRTGDYVVRWGGEEFLLVFRPMPMRNLQMIGNRLRDTVNEHAFEVGHGRTLQLTCSIGLSEYPLFRDRRGLVSWETMVELADQSLYYVKAHGRDGWAAFRPTETTDLATLLGDLHRGPRELLANGQLQLIRNQPLATD